MLGFQREGKYRFFNLHWPVDGGWSLLRYVPHEVCLSTLFKSTLRPGEWDTRSLLPDVPQVCMQQQLKNDTELALKLILLVGFMDVLSYVLQAKQMF